MSRSRRESQRITTVPGAIERRRAAPYACLGIASLVFAITVANGQFVAGGSDSSGYISAGDLWRRHDLFRADGASLWASWPNAGQILSPLGYRAGPISGTSVSSYPPGFPLLVAAAMTVGGALAGHLVAPIMAAVLVGCAFALARRIAGDGAGLVAAALMACSPVVLLNAVDAMSDIPAAACWMLAWLMALRATAGASAAAGLAASLAMLIRPNLAPLALIITMVTAFSRASDLGADEDARIVRWRRVAAFLMTASVGPLMLAWSQAALYGSPFASSYGAWQGLFDRAYVGTNLRMYPRLFAQTHTVLPVIGLALVPLALTRRRWHCSYSARIAVLSACALLVLNVLIYLPYTPFDHWPFVRFLLPGMTALMVLFAATLTLATRWLWHRLWWLALVAPVLALVAPVLALLVVVQGVPYSRYALDEWRGQRSVLLMGRYLHEVLPADAVVLSFMHSGAVTYYTGRPVVRLDVLDPPMLDGVVADLQQHGLHPVLVIDRLGEEPRFGQRFTASPLGRLDWPARAIFGASREIVYWDPSDRQRHQDGERWPIDIVR